AFLPHTDELGNISALGSGKESLLNLAKSDSIYGMLRDLTGYLQLAEKPYVELMKIAAMAVLGEPGAIRLLYASFMAIPPVEEFLADMLDFRSTVKVMERIAARERAGGEIDEKDDWFRKKVVLLSSSMPLPSTASYDPARPWLFWSEGAGRAIADPDDRWLEAVVERAKIELEAKEIRISKIISMADPETRGRLVVGLNAVVEESRWKKQILDETRGRRGSSILFVKEALGGSWGETIESLRKSRAGSIIAEMYERQAVKAHSYPVIKNGAAVIRALIMHPALQRTGREPDILSCLDLLIEYSGKGRLDMMLPLGKKVTGLNQLPGFSIEDRIMSVDFSGIDQAYFVDSEGLPVDVDWMEVGRDSQMSYKSLVMSYLDNDSFLTQLLNNPKATSKPGIVVLIAQRCRSLRILSLIANRRDLHTGFNNKLVPVELIKTPAKIPLTTLRKFIHIRYVDKMTLIKLAQKGTGLVREEVRREIERYLRNAS
ncbi:MAG TPA: hypothetical protein VLA34_08015, partial [Candidatus Krumholzibacterium sp.]|nr:hypothetical protein [Candidatus Krumholzibacterium sp.]